MLLLIAQTTPATKADALGILLSLIVIVGVAVIVAVIGFIFWRRFTREEDPALTRNTAFTLADLRQLHRDGQLSDAEFERARAAIIAQTRAALAPSDADDSPENGAMEDDASHGEADKPDDRDESDHSR